ncbi:MAG: LysE family translocator [Chloroflexota bacterium]
MIDLSFISLFVLVAIGLTFTPGPNTLYIIARTFHQGRKEGVISSLGVQVGTLVHVAIAALGLSVAIVSSPVAFNVIKYSGAAYLIYLGLRTLFSKASFEADMELSTQKLFESFRQGVIVNLLNPKTALFFFAFLPQFIDPLLGRIALQTISLGLILVLFGTMSDLTYVFAANYVDSWLNKHEGFLQKQNIVIGTVYLGLGILTAITSLSAV